MNKGLLKSKIELILIAFIMFFIIGTINVQAENVSFENSNSVIKLKITKKNGNVSYATGFLIGKKNKDANKYVVTAAHALEDYKTVHTSLKDQEPIKLDVKQFSEKADMVVLAVPAGFQNDFDTLKVGNAEKIKVADKVVLVGFANQDHTKPTVSHITISDINARNDFKALSVGMDVPDKTYYGSPVFDSKGAVIGLTTFSKSNSKTDIVYINYLSELLKETEYETQEAGIRMLIIIIAAAAVVIIAVLTIILVVSKKSRQKALSQNVAPIDHSDGRTMAIVPNSPKNNPSNVQGGGIGIAGVSGYFTGRKFPIGNHIIIGRDPKKVKIVFPDKTQGVSAVHCELRNNNGMVILVDLGSTYGTFLANGSKLQPSIPHTVSLGDEFYLGSPENRFRITE